MKNLHAGSRQQQEAFFATKSESNFHGRQSEAKYLYEIRIYRPRPTYLDFAPPDPKLIPDFHKSFQNRSHRFLYLHDD